MPKPSCSLVALALALAGCVGLDADVEAPVDECVPGELPAPPLCGDLWNGCSRVPRGCEAGAYCERAAGEPEGVCAPASCEGVPCGEPDQAGRPCLEACSHWALWPLEGGATRLPPLADASLAALPGSTAEAPRLLLFGGKTCAEPLGCESGDTWRFDGGNWSRLEVEGPPARSEHGAVAVPAGGAIPEPGGVLVFGGWDGEPGSALPAFFSDLWLFDGATWRELEATGTAPSPRAAFGMAYEPARRRVLVFGGDTARGLSDQLFALSLDDLSWSGIPAEVDGPGPRQNPVFVHHELAGATLLASGRDGPLLDDAWLLEGDRFRAIAPPLRPGPRGDASAAWDEGLGAVVIFGGNVTGGASVDSDETWLFDLPDGEPLFLEPPLADPARLESLREDEVLAALLDRAGVAVPLARDQATAASLPGGGVLLVGGQPGPHEVVTDDGNVGDGMIVSDTWVFRPYSP